jgi:hypothetical protein
VFVIGIVEWLKKTFNLQGVVVNIAALIVGVALSIGAAFASKPPATFGDWFLCLLYGIAFGLIASGIWDAIPRPAQG